LRGDRRLGPDARAAIRDPENDVAVSAASIWELEIKIALGKLESDAELLEEVRRVGYRVLPIAAEHAVAAARLPLHHRDPFDRLLIAQAQLEGLTVVTVDPRFGRYAVRTLAA
jgi:PIN domain nuclease of toxin-antitoxin system